RSTRDWSSDVCSSDLKNLVWSDASSQAIGAQQETIPRDERRLTQSHFDGRFHPDRSGDDVLLWGMLGLGLGEQSPTHLFGDKRRSEERRVGKWCRSRR